MKKILVSPSVLNADMSRLEEECISLEKCGADWIHCDVMDGVFVPNKALGVPEVAKIHGAVKIPLDVHLMIENPQNFVAQYVAAGADTITFHYEAADDVAALVQNIKKLGVKVGVSLKPATPVDVLVPFARDIDLVLVMTVEPGFGGQAFMPQMLEKVRRARLLFPDKYLQVDGGINPQTAKLAVEAGADVLVAGSYIVKAENRALAIEKLKNV